MRYVVLHGRLWDDLYIGFQNRISRDPDVYHHRYGKRKIHSCLSLCGKKPKSCLNPKILKQQEHENNLDVMSILATCGHLIQLFRSSDFGITSRSSCRSPDQTGSSSFISSRRSRRPSKSLKQHTRSKHSLASVLFYDSRMFLQTTKVL